MTDRTEDLPDFEEALRYAGDRDRRLDGENDLTTYPEDAKLWVHVYSQLLDLKRTVTETTEKRRNVLPEPAEPEVRVDLAIMHAEARRLEDRAEFWRRRLEELS